MWLPADPSIITSAACSFLHQRLGVAVRIFEEGHPEVMVVHPGDEMRFRGEGHATLLELGHGERYVGGAEVEAATGMDRLVGLFEQQPHSRPLTGRRRRPGARSG